MTRQEINLEILEYLKEHIHQNPTTRFHKMLFNMDINEFSEETKENIKKVDFDSKTTFKDKYNEESSTTLWKLNIKKQRL